MPCSDIFGILHPNPNNAACKKISQEFPKCKCEQESVRPDISPGKVEGIEHLARFIPNDPKYFDFETGEVKPNNFDWVKVRGLSTTRIEKAGDDNLKRQQDQGGYVGYLVGSTHAIRAIRHATTKAGADDLTHSEQVFAVYDTALADNLFHSDVCQSVFEDTDSTPKRERGALNIKFRRQLQEKFGNQLISLQ